MPKMCRYEYLRYLWTDLSGIKTKMYGKVCTLMWGPKLVCGGAIIGEKYAAAWLPWLPCRLRTRDSDSVDPLCYRAPSCPEISLIWSECPEIWTLNNCQYIFYIQYVTLAPTIWNSLPFDN